MRANLYLYCNLISWLICLKIYIIIYSYFIYNNVIVAMKKKMEAKRGLSSGGKGFSLNPKVKCSDVNSATVKVQDKLVKI